MENSRATYEGLLSLKPDQRPFVLTSATYAGGQRYAATWTGDNSATWNHLRLTTPMLLNLGLSGFGMSGADVGGFAGTPQPDLLTKWLEIAAFQPIDRDHTAKGTADQEPWVHGPQHEDIRRRYIEERYRLMPYLYTLAEEMSRTGLPIVRPLFLEFPNAATDGHPVDLDAASEFMFGPDLLIAPAPYPDELDPYNVELPPGQWFSYWTGERVGTIHAVRSRDAEQPVSPNTAVQSTTAPAAAGQPAAVPQTKATENPVPVTIIPTLETLPVYVRGGSILPIQPLVQSTSEIPRGPLTLRVYVGPDCHGTVYQDDGISFAYKRGAFLRMTMSCDVANGELHLHVSPHQGSFTPWWKQLSFEIYGFSPTATTASINNQPLPLTSAGPLQFTADDPGTGLNITVK